MSGSSFGNETCSLTELGAPLKYEPLRRGRSSDSSTTSSNSLISSRDFVNPSDTASGACPPGVRQFTETFSKHLIIRFLDSILSWSTMFGYTATLHLILVVSLAGYYFRCWPLGALAIGVTLSAFLPAEPLLWEGFQATALVSSWRRYFNFSIAVNSPLNTQGRYIFAEYPHGVFPVSQLLSRSLCLKLWPGLRIYSIAASVVFNVPIWRHIMTWTGARPATAKIFKQLLQMGSVALVPGGIAEMFITTPDHEAIKLRGRKGFVRIAVETGTPIVPVYHFGNSLLFRWIAPSWLERWARKLRVAVGYTAGRFGTPLPVNAPLFMAVGDPLPVPKMSPKHPDFNKVVDEVHQQFSDALIKLYYQYRGQYGWQDRELVVH